MNARPRQPQPQQHQHQYHPDATSTPTSTLTFPHHPPCPKPTNANGPPHPLLPTKPTPPKLTHPSTSQNNDSLTSLSQKVSALRSVTIDIYDNARDQHVIDSTSETFSSMTSSLTGSSRRLVTMAQSGNKVAVIKLAGILIGVAVLGYWILRWIF